MSWLNIDDKFAFHPKTVAAKNEAVGALVRMGAWSRDHRTDGRVPCDIAMLIAERDEVLQRLVAVRMLEFSGSEYVIHDFLDWNPSSKQTERLKKAKRAAGLRGAEARWQRNAKPMAAAMADAWQPDGSRARDQVQVQDQVQIVVQPPSPPTARKRPKRPKTPLPENWDPTGWVYDWARTDPLTRFGPEQVDRALTRFRSWAAERNIRLVDWDQRLRVWLQTDRERAPGLPSVDDDGYPKGPCPGMPPPHPVMAAALARAREMHAAKATAELFGEEGDDGVGVDGRS